MKRNLLLIIVLLVLMESSYGQELQTVHLNPEDSSVNMYIAVRPANTPIKAIMFLMPGAFQTPGDVLQQSMLPQYASQKGILTIIPLFETGISSFGIDSLTQRSLANQVKDAIQRYKLKEQPLFIGGFSLGGSCAVKYAELATQNAALPQPKALFAIDPPLDFERYYNAAKRIVRLSANAQINQEVPYMMGRIEKEMGGTPQNALKNFYRLSPYSYSDSNQTATKMLINMPVMFISEPDIGWWLAKRGYDFSFVNVTDQSAMINELQRLGNNKAVLVTTHNRGFRKPDNQRHPHSFSIVDNEKLVSWLLNKN